MTGDISKDMQYIIGKVPYGKVFLTVGNNEGKTVSIHASYMDSVGKYKNNSEAMMAIQKIVDEIEREKKNGGAITLTLHPRDGIIQHLTRQNTDRMTYLY